jgi:hypothetical protein
MILQNLFTKIAKHQLGAATTLLQLTLDFIFIVFKSFVFSVGFIKFSFEHFFSKTNPGTVDEEELVASLIDKGVICATALLYIFIPSSSEPGDGRRG